MAILTHPAMALGATLVTLAALFVTAALLMGRMILLSLVAAAALGLATLGHPLRLIHWHTSHHPQHTVRVTATHLTL